LLSPRAVEVYPTPGSSRTPAKKKVMVSTAAPTHKHTEEKTNSPCPAAPLPEAAAVNTIKPNHARACRRGRSEEGVPNLLSSSLCAAHTQEEVGISPRAVSALRRSTARAESRVAGSTRPSRAMKLKARPTEGLAPGGGAFESRALSAMAHRTAVPQKSPRVRKTLAASSRALALPAAWSHGSAAGSCTPPMGALMLR
jgi:hypothetical protein